MPALRFLLILLGFCAAPAYAYIGPGSGLSLLGGLWSLLLGIVLALTAIALWPLKLLLRRLGVLKPKRRASEAGDASTAPASAVSADEASEPAMPARGGWKTPLVLLAGLGLLAVLGAPDTPEPAAERRLVVLGFDGMDPGLAERWMAEGKLPNFSRLAADGHYQRLGTSNPPQSPVAWSDFATGEHAGHHGIFDFLRRDPETYAPRFSISEDIPPGRYLEMFGLKIPLGSSQTVNLRRGEPFWVAAERAGARATVLRVPVTWPPDEIHRMLSGMGVPDLIGSQGTYTLFTTSRLGTAGDASRVVRVRPEIDGRIETELPGPPNPLTADGTALGVALSLAPAELGVRVRIGDFDQVLQRGQWSRWVRLRFDATGPIRIAGNVRLLLVEDYPRPQLYVSPIQIDPIQPAAPLSWPPEYAAELAERIGLFHTLGMPEETWSLNEEHIADADWLAMVKTILDEREAMWFDALDRNDSELVVGVFVQTDRVSHMFWRGMDREHPRHADTAPEHRDAIEWIYREADRILGETLARLGPDDELLVLSDHGFAPFRHAVHLNRWLVDNGYLALQSGAAESDVLFRTVDWSRSRAYALGLNGLFINRTGRESQGIVEVEQIGPLKRELIDGLAGWADPDSGASIIRRVFDSSEIYPGGENNVETPDLVVGYERGYRASWQTTLGAVPIELLEPNRQKWSGDHCIDPALVPGVLFANFTPEPGVVAIDNMRALIEARTPDSSPTHSVEYEPGRERGLLDLPGIAFDRIERSLAKALPTPLRLTFWALLSAWMTMWVYRAASNQVRLAAVRKQSRALRAQISGYDGEFNGLLPLIGRNLALAGRQLRLALGPALLAGLPVLFVMVWISVAYGPMLPLPGSTVEVEAQPIAADQSTKLQWQGAAALAEENDGSSADGSRRWTLTWPRPSTPAQLLDGNHRTVAELPPRRATPVLHPKRWWNTLIANPGGYLAVDGAIDTLRMNLPDTEVLGFGPTWMRGWPFLYFLLLVAGAVWLKVRWKVN